MKHLLFVTLIFVLALLSGSGTVHAADAYWNQCSGSGDTSAIVRCETYDCPQGDTNKDGRCSLADTDARFQESKNDAFCANPLSGCGEVLYYSANKSNQCAIRVKESQSNCVLYKASSPTFTSTPTPTPTVTPRVLQSPSPSATASATPKSTLPTVAPTAKPKTLPKTGAELWISIVVGIIGVYGLYLGDKTKHS